VAHISLKHVPRGYRVHFPHLWVQLDAHEERVFPLVVVPFMDVSAYTDKGREAPSSAPVSISGYLERQYDEALSTGDLPGSTFRPIGGILARVTPKRATRIELGEDKEGSDKTTIGVRGVAAQAQQGERIIVEVWDLDDPGSTSTVSTKTDGQGRFAVAVKISALSGRRGRRNYNGRFAARASTLVATTLAEAESNTVTIVR
jgi:hypothetical protein